MPLIFRIKRPTRVQNTEGCTLHIGLDADVDRQDNLPILKMRNIFLTFSMYICVIQENSAARTDTLLSANQTNEACLNLQA